jgi:hypothetical protein
MRELWKSSKEFKFLTENFQIKNQKNPLAIRKNFPIKLNPIAPVPFRISKV